MPEPVRLVIWDLDETFWRGTLTEGGIREYVQAHHDIVIELARRGIISSICSKNDEAPVREILQRHGLWDYFVFPSISWEPKGTRVAQIIEAIQLRPSTVMFIDDNPNNLAEAAALVPGLQVADETVVPSLLEGALFTGKADNELTRLKQYKVIEQKNQDKITAKGDNRAFLQSCDIRVKIEYDVAGNLDRAIELINRTNQLNFTKRRLSEDVEQARSELLAEISPFSRQAGLVQVLDKYGDYGTVGLFLQEGPIGDSRLLHFCFSCRTLGMLVEAWMYAHLGRPKLDVVGDVLTNLSIEHEIDWIRLVSDAGEQVEEGVSHAPEIRIVGGCEANAIAHYLMNRTQKLLVEANFASQGMFVRVNSSRMLLSAADRQSSPAFAEEADRLAMPLERLVSRFFDDAAPESVLVLGTALDTGYLGYRHKTFKWDIMIEPADGFYGNLTITSPEELDAHFAKSHWIDETQHDGIRQVAAHVRENYDAWEPSVRSWGEDMQEIFSRVPVGARLLLLAPDAVIRDGEKSKTLDWVANYTEWLKAFAADVPFVGLVSFGDHIKSFDEIHHGYFHYDRMVYFRVAQALIDLFDEVPAKTESDALFFDARELNSLPSSISGA